jgi:hypothetical protein
VTLSTTPARYSVTIAIPSVSGKTLGTNGNDYTSLSIWLSSGTTQSSRAGNIGVQTGSIAFWGVQLEIGTQATPLEKPDPRYDLANCQRFYFSGNLSNQGAGGAAGVEAVSQTLPVHMRATPTLTAAWSNVNVSNPVIGAMNGANYQFYGTTPAGGQYIFGGGFTASADL